MEHLQVNSIQVVCLINPADPSDKIEFSNIQQMVECFFRMRAKIETLEASHQRALTMLRTYVRDDFQEQ